MAPMTSISNSINSYLIIIVTLYITNISSQRIYCGGAPGSICSCPAAGDPTVPSGSTCILDCSQTDMCKGQILECRAGDPCEIHCAGEQSCRDGAVINGYSATDVKVTCLRDDSCSNKMAIHCGTGDCLLQCFHRQSCQSWIQGTVSTLRAKSFLCEGQACPHFQLPWQFSMAPTSTPTSIPTDTPTSAPTNPTQNPTITPTNNPSYSPTKRPTMAPTPAPTNGPTSDPTFRPTANPTISPTNRPSTSPTPHPTSSPTIDPTVDPTVDPTMDPTRDPTITPTQDPTMDPTEPTDAPSEAPTVYEEAQAAEFLNSTGWTALISILTISVFCFMLILIIVVFYKKYQKETLDTQARMAGITRPDGTDTNTQHKISYDTDPNDDDDITVVDGMETTTGTTGGAGGGNLASFPEIDIHMLHSLNTYQKQDKRKMASTNGGKPMGEYKEFEMDPNLVGAFMFGGGTDAFGEEQEEEEDPCDDDYVNPFHDPPVDEPNELQLQEADSIDEMGLMQQQVKLMRLLQQQYELMSDYNIEPVLQGQKDHNVDMGY